MNKKQMPTGLKTALTYLTLVVGSFIAAISTYMFLIPAKLIPGGVTGIASVIQTVFGFPSQYTIVIINVPILIAALFLLDKKFVLRTVIAILLVSGFMELFSRVNMYRFVSEAQPLIPAIVSGILSGVGIGLLLNADASSGGTEVLGMMIRKKTQKLKLAQLLLVMNVVTMTFGSVMYLAVAKMDASELIVLLVCSIIQSVLCSKSVDFILNGINAAVKFEIVTKMEEDVSHAILSAGEYGVTVIESKGAYSEEKSYLLVCVVHKSKVPEFKRLIKSVDPQAFVFTTDTREILGTNFQNNI